MGEDESAGRLGRGRREQRYGHRGGVFWLTGLSGAGKSTLAFGVEQRLFRTGMQVVTLDGDRLRAGVCADLGYSLEDRRENVRRMAELAALLAGAGQICLCACIAPLRAFRRMSREIIGPDYHEIYVRCPLEVCRARDVKGLYARVEAGTVREYTGVSSPYEPPEKPDLVLSTHELEEAHCLDLLEAFVRERTV